MSTIRVKNVPCHTYGNLPEIGGKAPNFSSTTRDLETVTLEQFKQKAMLINVYPSIDTDVCFQSVEKFKKFLPDTQNTIIACVSMDLPFALRRVCEGEQLDDVLLLSDFRNREFGDLYGLTIADGPLAGLLARAVIVLDEHHHVIYTELVSDIANPPNYEKALEALTNKN